MGRKHWIGASVVLSLLAGCSDEHTGSTDQAATTQNGAWQNGLTSNALFSNGAWQNGAWQNGVLQNGAWQNGAWQNGAWQNGAWQNGAWQNGAWQNGAWQNGAWQNGAWQNGAWQNGAWQNGAQLTQWQNGTWNGALWTSEFWQVQPRHDLLRDNPYTAKVLQYIYSCAMKTGTNRVIDAGGGISITLTGGIGLAPTWDSPTGACDETCQRWVSACVLARTNAYGVTVDISMRVPDSAPTGIKEALAVTPSEATDYPNREGTYFGNIFATTPSDSTGEFITNTPELLACAGPYSNLPDLTKRFVSSQGDGGPVQVLGTCEAHTSHPAVCAGLDANGVETACFGPPMRTDGTPSEYDEAITVYLKTPITNCGNSVCESGESTDACPSDCHPGTSAVNLGVGMAGASNIPWGTENATPTPDGNVLVGNVVYGSIDLGGGPTNGTTWNFVLAKYTRSGTLLWSKSYGTNLGPFEGFTITTASNGTIAIAVPNFGTGMYVAELASDGAVLPGWPINIAGTGRVTPNGTAALDGAGNLYMSGTFESTATFGAQSLTSTGLRSSFFAKFASDGTVAWATSRSPSNPFDIMDIQGLALDPRGSVFVEYFGNGGGIDKLDATTGALRWHVEGEFHGAAVDANGDVYVSYDRFYAYLLKLSGSDGHELGRAQATRVCDTQPNPGSQGPCTSGILTGLNIALDGSGNVLMSSSGGGGPRGFDFGAGEFRAYGTYDSYISAYRASDLKFRWAKHVPFVLDGGQNSFTVDRASGAVTMIGAFSGSMLFDDRILVNTIPEIGGHQEVFIASFNQPSPTDTMPPVMSDMPNHIVVQATSSAGANVFYSNPLATDAGNSGTNVVCSPMANTFFAIGNTTVNCVAYDPLGNKTATQSFVVTVEDNNGPIFSAKAIAPTVQATSSGMVLQYDLPLAFDELANQYVTVTCTPPSGSSFVTNMAIAITCSAVDGDGNTSAVGYLVTVTQDPALGTGASSYTATVGHAIVPSITITGPGLVEATGPDGARVTFTATSSDGAPPTCSKNSGDVFPLGQTVVTCTTTNAVGFSNATTYRVLVQDTTPPVLTVVPPPATVPATSSSGAIVSFPTSATDLVTANPGLSCTPPSGSLFVPGPTTVTCSATDEAHNTATQTFTVQVDSPPRLILPIAPVTAPVGSTVTYTVSATDDLGGATVSCDHASGSTFAIGTTTVTCTATDSSGQKTTGSFTVQVTAPWTGFLQPINSDGSSIFKQGSTIPVKFAGPAGLVATIRIQKLSNNVTGSDLEVASSGTADTGTTFRYDATGGIYIFNLATSSLTAGTYVVSANLGDGVWHSVNVSLKK